MDVSKIQGPGEGAHTPGPWEVFTDHRGEVHVLARHGGSITALNRIATDEGILATARVIAAAPDLLAAMPTIGHPGGRLVRVVAHYEDGATQTIDGEVIAAAVAKATGSAA